MPASGSKWPEGFGRGRDNRGAVVVLSALRGLTPRRLLELARREGSASACLASIRSGGAGSAADQRFARALDPGPIEDAVAACGARIIVNGDAEYPHRLEALADPPATLFVRGRSLAEVSPAVSIVGARRCTALGSEIAEDFGRALGAAGAWVVSGAARGIDAAAHEGALASGGRTVAVLGCGIDVAYPPGSRSLISRIAGAGAVVSEYPPGVPAEPFRFPARNRIVAAFGRALVVVEGAPGSGSLISADHALELGRQVFAVPGAVNNPLAEVPFALIRDGAVPIRGADDLLEELGLERREAKDASLGSGPGLDGLEAAAFSKVTGAVLPEAVARELDLTVPQVVHLLMSLEMKGFVRSVGGRFERRLSRGTGKSRPRR